MSLKPVLGSQLNLGHRLSQGLVFYPPFNEGSGNIVFDLSGNGNNGILVGNTHWVPGKFGSGIDLDGADDWINIPDSPSLDSVTATSGLTMVALFYPRTYGEGDNARIINKADDGGTNGWSMLIRAANPDALGFQRRGLGDNVMIANVVTLNAWNYGVVTVGTDGKTINVYNNGVFKGSGTLGVAMGANDLPLRIGNRSGDDAREFDGLIDHVLIYNHALNASEIAELYQEPFAMFDRMPIELWVGATSVGVPPVGIQTYMHHYQQAS